MVGGWATYVNPLISVNSCLISPPWDLASSLALSVVQLSDSQNPVGGTRTSKGAQAMRPPSA